MRCAYNVAVPSCLTGVSGAGSPRSCVIRVGHNCGSVGDSFYRLRGAFLLLLVSPVATTTRRNKHRTLDSTLQFAIPSVGSVGSRFDCPRDAVLLHADRVGDHVYCVLPTGGRALACVVNSL